MSGPRSGDEFIDCPKGQKDLKRGGEALKVAIHHSDGCDKTNICKIVCQYKKKS